MARAPAGGRANPINRLPPSCAQSNGKQAPTYTGLSYQPHVPRKKGTCTSATVACHSSLLSAVAVTLEGSLVLADYILSACALDSLLDCLLSLTSPYCQALRTLDTPIPTTSVLTTSWSYAIANYSCRVTLIRHRCRVCSGTM